MDIGLWCDDFDEFLHELKTQMAILENDPVSGFESKLDGFTGGYFLTLTHGNFFTSDLLLFLGKIIDRGGGVGTS